MVPSRRSPAAAFCGTGHLPGAWPWRCCCWPPASRPRDPGRPRPPPIPIWPRCRLARCWPTRCSSDGRSRPSWWPHARPRTDERPNSPMRPGEDPSHRRSRRRQPRLRPGRRPSASRRAGTARSPGPTWTTASTTSATGASCASSCAASAARHPIRSVRRPWRRRWAWLRRRRRPRLRHRRSLPSTSVGDYLWGVFGFGDDDGPPL